MIDLRKSDCADGQVATVVIENAAKRNCLDRNVRRAFVGAFDDLSKDETLRAIVLTGAGERAFIGGADVEELAELDPQTAAPFITEIHDCCEAVRRSPVPVIARIRGYALGAGLEIAAACDIRVATTDSYFGMPEVKLGMPSVIEAALLPQLIGWGRTRYLLLTGETVSAAAAHDWGLFEFVVPPEELDLTVERMCCAIAECGPKAVRDQKALIRDWERLPIDQAVQRGVEVFEATWRGDEAARMAGSRLAAMRRK
ncbi:MAG TPA: enoyl-CoA hydratase [Alphaproteobacteria bacterium]|nr:enoyl-CoA hydratase [Alphaproteobacteria bacterium]